MFTVTLTSYGQTQISDLVQIDGIILLYEYVSDISSISNISSYTQVLDEDSAGNIKNNICNVLISDSSSSEYQAHTILFYKNNGGTKNILGGYSAEEPFIKKSASSVNLWFSFDFSAFTNGFALSAIKAGFANASHNEDGLLHLENPNTISDDNYSVYNKSQVDALLQDKQSTLSAGDGIAISNGTVKTTGIPFGIVDNTSTATVFTVTVPGIYKLEDGVCCLLKNGVITSATGFTLEVNGLGAKPVYSNMAAATRETTIFNVNYTMLFVYDSTRIEGGAWICYRGYFSDANSIAYQIRGNVHTLPTTAKFYRYRLLFTSADGTHFVPSNTSTSTNATAKRDVVQTPIDPFGEIVYYSTTTAVEANANPGPTYLWTQYAITFGYSFNRTGATLTLTSFSPVYIKCAPQSNGSAIIDADTPYVQALPNTADGKIYIFLGVANSATAVELLNNHPIYYHDGTGIRIWHGKDSYSKSELDTIIADYVQTSRTINNKPLTSNITLTLDDVSDGTNRSIPTVNNSTITIKKNSSDTGDTFTTNAASNKTINLGLATVATSGSYNDLSDKPTATVINDSTITIKKNSDDTGDSFTTNNATAKTINLDLHTVATSGSYNDLSNKPTIPTVNNAKLTIKKDTNDTGTEFTANASSDVTCNLGLHTVATSGSYNDLSNKPTIPTVNNSTITIKKNTSDTGDSFTTNAASGKTINLGLSTVASSGSYNDLSNKPTIPTVPEDVSAFNNDAGYLTSYTETDPTVPSWAKQTNKPSYTLDEVTDGTTRKLSNYVPTSRKVNNKALTSDITLTLDDVADGTNRSIPTVNNSTITIKKNTNDTGDSFTTNASSGKTINLGLSTVATSGSYNDLSNKPTIPTVNNATLTIQKNGTTVKTFTANASSNVTANITVPTTTSQLTNNSGFITSSDLPTNHVTTNTNQSITGQKTFVTATGGGTGNDIKIAFVENAQHYITIASSAGYNDDYISPYFRMSFIGNSGDLSTYIETKATYTHNQLSDEYDLTDIVSASELSNTWSLGSNRSMLKSIYTSEINNSFTNAISFASTETTFNKEINLVLAKDTNTYIYGGNELPDNDYRHWWANYDQVNMSYTSISISMTEDVQYDTTLNIPIDELSSVTPFGRLIVDTTSYNLSIGTTSVTSSLKSLIESGSYSPLENYVFLCFDSSNFPSNIIGVVICAELTNQGQTASEKLMFFIPSNDLELVGYQHNPSQGTYFIVNNSGSYSFSNNYNFNYRIITKTSIKDYVDGRVNSIVSNGVDYASSAGSATKVYVSRSSSSYSYPLVFTEYATAGGTLSANNKSLYTDTANSVYYNPSTNTLTCPNFAGNVTGNLTGNVTGNADTATKATKDSDGNIITSYYCTLSTDQTVTGNKTFTSNVYITTSSSSNNLYVTGYSDGCGIRLGDSTSSTAYPMIVGETHTGSSCDLRQNYYIDNTLKGTIQTNCDSSGNLVTTSKIGKSTVTTGKWSLGDSDSYLKEIYVNDLHVNSDIIPSSSMTYDLGSTTYLWDSIYAFEFRSYGDKSNYPNHYVRFHADTGSEIGTTRVSSITSYTINNNQSIFYLITEVNTNSSYVLTSAITKPKSTNVWSIGTSSLALKEIYVSGSNSSYMAVLGNSGNSSYTYPTLRPTTSGYGYLGLPSYKWGSIYVNNIGSSSTRVSSAYVDSLYVTSDGTLLSTYISNRIASVVSGTGIGSIRLFCVTVAASTTTTYSITYGTTFDSSGIKDSGGVTRTISFASMASSWNNDNAVGFIRCFSQSGTISGTWKVLHQAYMYNTNTSHGVNVPILAIRTA